MLKHLFVFNGAGRKLFAFTRRDKSGGRFATVWWVEAGMPIYPIGRFYIIDGGDKSVNSTSGPHGYAMTTTTSSSYRFIGKAKKNLKEVVGTYVWAWLVCPAAIALPVWFLIELFREFSQRDIDSVALSVVLFVLWIVTLIALPGLLLFVLKYWQARFRGDDFWR